MDSRPDHDFMEFARAYGDPDRKALDVGLFALKFLAVVNGGGLLALLHVFTSEHATELRGSLEIPAWCFLFGLWLTGVAAIFGYFYRNLGKIRFLEISDVMGALSFVPFTVGAGWAIVTLT